HARGLPGKGAERAGRRASEDLPRGRGTAARRAELDPQPLLLPDLRRIRGHAVYLPTFLTDMFKLTPADAGLRTAGFVVLATAMRPLGGILADKVGGQRVLFWVFPATAVMAVFLAFPTMTTFTVGALGMATAIGLGNGAVFKLVPQYFPKTVGSVTGLVGAAGGLGGFFPPLVLGFIKQATGSY